MQYLFKPSGLDDLKKLPRQLQVRIIEKLDFYSGTQSPLEFAEPIRDHAFGEYRYRVGPYRIFFDIKQNKIIVLRIKHRRDAYR